MREKSLTIHIDGAARGNPGKAGIGLLIYDSRMEVVGRLKEYIGVTTNNVAEYTALIYALQEALILQAERLNILTDSELLVRQFEGSYRVKDNDLRRLFKQVNHLRKGFKDVSLKRVDRKVIKDADQLANDSIEEVS